MAGEGVDLKFALVIVMAVMCDCSVTIVACIVAINNCCCCIAFCAA